MHRLAHNADGCPRGSDGVVLSEDREGLVAGGRRAGQERFAFSGQKVVGKKLVEGKGKHCQFKANNNTA